MAYRRLMVHVDPSPDTGPRIRLAVELATALNATLIGISAAEVGEPLTLSSGLPAPLLDERQRNLTLTLAALERNFPLLAQGCVNEWLGAVSSPIAFATENARTADLLIVGRGVENPDYQDFDLSPASLLLNAGRPVLIAPPGVASLSADHIVVAWKSSPSARAAIQQALPLLKRAGRVTVLGVGQAVAQSELDDVCIYLRAHGAKAQAQRRDKSGQSTADIIVETAAGDGADLIVCGGYGRARAVEWVFGGVTKALLEHSPICCLMAH